MAKRVQLNHNSNCRKYLSWLKQVWKYYKLNHCLTKMLQTNKTVEKRLVGYRRYRYQGAVGKTLL
jgi:hypothetical protein